MARKQPSPATLNLLGEARQPSDSSQFHYHYQVVGVAAMPCGGGRGNTKRKKEVHINC
jgi:hypothetical protein